MGWSSARTNMLHDLDEEMAEEEHQRQERQRGDQQRSGEQDTEKPVVVLEVHVEHYDDQELERRQNEQRGYEPARRYEGRNVVRPDFADRDQRENERDLPVGGPGRVGVLDFSVRRVRSRFGGIGKIGHAGVSVHRSAVT